MKKNQNTWEQVNMIAQLADLKQTNYRQALALSALIELLVEKGVISPDDFHRKAAGMERDDLNAAKLASYSSATESHAVDRS